MTHQIRLNLKLQNIVNFNRNDVQSLRDIVISINRLFSEVKDSVFSQKFLPQIEVLVLLLESKTQKKIEHIITDLNTNYIPSH